MELTKVIEQDEDIFLEITVNYLPKEDAIDEIFSVVAFDEGFRIDVTPIFMKHFDHDLDKIILETNWKELYNAKMEPSL